MCSLFFSWEGGYIGLINVNSKISEMKLKWSRNTVQVFQLIQPYYIFYSTCLCIPY